MGYQSRLLRFEKLGTDAKKRMIITVVEAAETAATVKIEALTADSIKVESFGTILPQARFDAARVCIFSALRA